MHYKMPQEKYEIELILDEESQILLELPYKEYVLILLLYEHISHSSSPFLYNIIPNL